MSDLNLSEPRRQNPVGVVVYILRNFRAIAAVFIATISMGSANPKVWIYIGILIIPMMVVLALFAYYQYRNFTFQVLEDELIIRKGVIFKDRTVIPADRIQSIQITSNLVQRIFSLVSLKVDTAGSKGNELEIPALERSFANELKALLYERKEKAMEGEGALDQAQPNENTNESEEDKREEVLVHLSIVDLIKVGLTENHLKTGFIALAFVFGTWSQYQEFVERYFSGYIDEYAEEVANAGLRLIAMFLVIYALMSVLISLARTFLRFFDLKTTLKSRSIEISTGLFKRNQDRIPIKKIQFVEWETNPLRRLVGFESARLHPSNSAGEASKKQRIEIPALKQEQSALLATGVFPEFVLPAYAIPADAFAYARFGAIIASFFLIPIAAIGFYYFEWPSLFVVLCYVPIVFLSYQFGKNVEIGLNNKYVVIKKGWIFPVRIVLPGFKMQSIAFHQNIFLKRRKLAHVKIYTAAGSRSVRYLSEIEAFKLYNYLLYKVESHTGDWM